MALLAVLLEEMLSRSSSELLMLSRSSPCWAEGS